MPDFTDALDKARAELAKLRRERQQLDIKIAKMEQLVGALNTVNADEDDAIEMTGFTDAIRAVLKNSVVALSPTDIRDQLTLLGFDFAERYSNLLASIHVVLKRLVKSQEVMELSSPFGKSYWWTMNGSPTQAMDNASIYTVTLPASFPVPPFVDVPDFGETTTIAKMRREALLDKMKGKK